MGRTTKWLRSLFSGSRKPPPEHRRKTGLSLPKSADTLPADGHVDANKHAIAVAAATAAVAEAALAAAQAAAEVVRLTSASGSSVRNDAAAAYLSANRRRAAAAVRIQSAFRAYLARRALRALKGLVKLQALVRGHIVRKQSADMLRRMQAMARIQARASAHRAEPVKFEHPHHQGAVNRRNYHQHTNKSKQGGSMLKQYTPRLWNSNSHKTEISHQPSNWLHHWMDKYAWNDRQIDDDQTDRILEIDTWKPHQPSLRSDRMTIPTTQYSSAWNDIARHSTKLQKPNPSISSEVSSTISPKGDQGEAAYMAENNPSVQSASCKPTMGPFTPTRSECSRSLFGDYLSHYPNYMANTESSRAKVRSQSAPKQRMQMEELGMSQGLWEPDASSEKGFALAGNYRGTPYPPHPGHLRRQGTPARGAYTGLGSTYGQRL